MIYLSDYITDTRPRIGYENLAVSVAGSSSATGFPAAAVLNPMTYERWRPTVAPANMIIDLGAIKEIDYVALLHELQGATLSIYHRQGSSGDWTTICHELVITDNTPSMFVFEPVNARYISIVINQIREINVVYVGKVLTIETYITGSHAPGMLSRKTDIRSNRSETGQFLGRSVMPMGYETSYAFDFLPAQWVRDKLDPFVEFATKRPFFIAAEVDRFPEEVLYGWCNRDIHPSYTGALDYMSVSFQVEAI